MIATYIILYCYNHYIGTALPLTTTGGGFPPIIFSEFMHEVHTCTCTALGVLCCFALFVCLTLLASFFLPSPISHQNMYIHIAPVVLDHMDRVASTMAERGLNFKLREGLSAETSGEVSSVPVLA